MKKFKLIAAAALVASLASCSKQDFIETKKEFQEGEEVAFTASKLAKSVAKTKVSHELNEEGTQLLNKWEANDAIKLYTEDYESAWGENDGLFQVVDPDAENVVFRGLATVNQPAKAVYPYDAKIIVDENGILTGVDLPTSQSGLGREATFLADYNPDGPVNFEFKPYHSIVVLEREAFLEKVGVSQDDFTSFTVKVIEENDGLRIKSYFVRPISEAKSAKYWYVAIEPVSFWDSVISIEFQNNKKLSVNVNPGPMNGAVAYNISPDAVVSAIPEGFVDLGVVNDKGKKVFWGESNILHSPITSPSQGSITDLESGTLYMFGFPEKIYSSISFGLGSTYNFYNQYKDYGFGENSYPAEYKNKYFNQEPYGGKVVEFEVEPCDDIAYRKNNAWRTPSENDWESLLNQCFFVVCNDGGKSGYITVYKAKDNSHKGITAIGSEEEISNWTDLEYYKNSDFSETSPVTMKYSEEDTHITLIPRGYMQGKSGNAGLSNYLWTRTTISGAMRTVVYNSSGEGSSYVLRTSRISNLTIMGGPDEYIGCCIRPVAYGN